MRSLSDISSEDRWASFLHGESFGPVISESGIVDWWSFWGLQASILGLFAKRVDPLVVSLVDSSYEIILRTILKLFLAQLQAPLDFDLLHAAVLWLALYVIGWHEKSLVRVERLDARITHLTFVLPNVGHFNDFLSLSLREEWPETLDLGWTNVHLLTRSHAQGQLYTS